MATHTTLASLFTAIADAIRAKTGSAEPIVADDFPTAISNISAGSNLRSFEVTDNYSQGLGPTGVYQFEKGMTWKEFVESEYNVPCEFGDKTFEVSGSSVSGYGSGGMVVLVGSNFTPSVNASQRVVDGGEYEWAM
jgi:hypothetical protein